MLDGIVYMGNAVYYELYFGIDILASFRLKSWHKISMRVRYLDFEDFYD